MSDLGNKAIMAKNITHYMELHDKSRNEMCEALGVKYTTFTDWVKGNSYPRIDKIELMANYFGISKSDLVEERKPDTAEPPQQEAADELDDSEQFLIDVYRDLNEEGKDRLVDYADDLHSMDKYKKGDKSIPASA